MTTLAVGALQVLVTLAGATSIYLTNAFNKVTKR